MKPTLSPTFGGGGGSGGAGGAGGGGGAVIILISGISTRDGARSLGGTCPVTTSGETTGVISIFASGSSGTSIGAGMGVTVTTVAGTTGSVLTDGSASVVRVAEDEAVTGARGGAGGGVTTEIAGGAGGST
jgi:hypothetical protein